MFNLKSIAIGVAVVASLVAVIAYQRSAITKLSHEVEALESRVASLRSLNASLRAEIYSDRRIDEIPDSDLGSAPPEWLLPPRPR